MNISKKNTSFLAALVAAAMAISAGGAQAGEVLTAKVVSANESAQVDLGSKKALGYYGKRNGKCALTVMLIEDEQGTEPAAELSSDVKNASAARLTVAIAPGTTASVESAQGRKVAFFCNSEARRMTVMTLSEKSDAPRS